MRRMENDLLFFHELIGTCSVEKDSKIYTISPKFGKGTMQSFEVMPGAEIVYSNVHITTPIQKNIQCPAMEYSGHEYEHRNHVNRFYNSFAPVCVLQTGAFCRFLRFCVGNQSPHASIPLATQR